MIVILSTSPNIGYVSLKINPIQSAYNYKPYYNSSQKNLVTKPEPDTILAPMPDNYGRAMVFKGINGKMKDIIANAPFEDKLALGFQELIHGGKTGNYLLAAKNMKEISRLMEFLDMPVPIKKLTLVTDERFNDTLLFMKTGNFITFVNTNDKEVVTSEPEILFPGESAKIFMGERLRTSFGWFDLKDQPKGDIDLETHAGEFMQVLDFSEDIYELYIKHNKEIIKFIKDLEKPKTKSNELTFASVGGQDEVIESLRKNILFPLKYPEVFDGFMMSRGAILYGPPGTGKTLLAKALAAESGASVFEQSATEFANKYVGESEKNCRELFQKAVDAQPSIIYLDEIDALGSKRGEDTYGDKLLAQFLSSMSELEKRGDRVYIIGSTNRKEALDPAFIRSGRFSTLLEVKAPDLKGTRQILEIHTNKKPLDENLNLDEIAQKMFEKKMTGADIAATVKEAFSNALERTGIYESMKQNRFSSGMKEYLVMTSEDFNKAIESFDNDTKGRTPVGFKPNF